MTERERLAAVLGGTPIDGPPAIRVLSYPAYVRDGFARSPPHRPGSARRVPRDAALSRTSARRLDLPSRRRPLRGDVRPAARLSLRPRRARDRRCARDRAPDALARRER